MTDLELENKRLKYVINTLLKEIEHKSICEKDENWDHCEKCPLFDDKCFIIYCLSHNLESTEENHKRFLWQIAKENIKGEDANA